MQRSILVIDGNSWMHRAFHAIQAPLTAPDGTPTNAIFGFFSILANVISQIKPDGVVVAFDDGKPAFRLDALAQYKMQRPPTDPRLKLQFPVAEELLRAMQVPVIRIKGWEGDDILGTLATKATEQNVNAYLASGDRDIYQLITDTVSVVSTKAGAGSEVVIIRPDDVMDRYGISTNQITDYLGLKGDPSDNIPGVPGIGEKTAAKLLQEFGTLEVAVEAAHSGKVAGRVGKNLIEHCQSAYDSRTVATIVRDVPFEIDLTTLSYPDFDADTVTQAFSALGVRAPLSKLLAYRGSDAESNSTVSGQVAAQSPLGVANPVVNLGSGNLASSGTSKESGTETSAFSPHLATSTQIAQPQLPAGVNVPDNFDCEIAAYLLDSTAKSYDVSILSHNYLGIELPEQTSLLESGADEQEIVEKLIPLLACKLYASDMWGLYTQIELPLAPILKEMEDYGVKLEIDYLATLAVKGRKDIETLRGEIYELAGRSDFVIDSPKQLGEVLFETLGLPARKKKKTGYSTDASVLADLKDHHPIIRKISRYRELVKLQSTYIEALPRLVDSTNRLHTTFNQTVTATGRLSSTNPNLQNIPVRTEIGRRIRRAFVPTHPHWQLVSADYSQIELRVLAHLSGDKNLIEAFNSGQDFHTATAARVFDVDPGEVTSQMRSKAKAVNFGIVYGQSAHGLAQTLGISNGEARTMIDRYYNAYPQVNSYLHEQVDHALRDGWVSTAYGRRRNIVEMHSPSYQVREFGKRTAMNHPMQGTAADLMKIAMINVAGALADSNLEAKMMLQVHDELIFECPEAEIERLQQLAIDVMSNVADFSVPLSVSVSAGENWAQAK